MKSFNFTLRSPIASVFTGEVDGVQLATKEGEMEILPGHTSIVGMIDFSVVKVRKNGHTDEYYVRNGTMSVDPNGEEARILAQDVQDTQSLDKQSMTEYMNFILEKLKNPSELSKYQVEFLEEQRGALEKSFKVIEQK